MTDDDTLIAILRRIIVEPDVDLHRLVYADRLEELGEGERAEFVRVQVEAERIRGGGCWVVLRTECDGTKEWCVRCGLVSKFKKLWRTVGVEFEKYGVAARSRMVRGFAEEWECDAETFLKYADALVWHPTQNRPCPPTAQPIRKVRLTTKPMWGVSAEFSRNGGSWDRENENPFRVWYHRWPGVEFELPRAANVVTEDMTIAPPESEFLFTNVTE